MATTTAATGAARTTAATTGVARHRGSPGGIVLVVGIFWAQFLYSPERHNRRKLWKQRAINIVAFLICVFGALALFHSMTGAFNDSWVWPFNTPGWHVPMAPMKEGRWLGPLITSTAPGEPGGTPGRRSAHGCR
jgi:hypothetical protein